MAATPMSRKKMQMTQKKNNRIMQCLQEEE